VDRRRYHRLEPEGAVGLRPSQLDEHLAVDVLEGAVADGAVSEVEEVGAALRPPPVARGDGEHRPRSEPGLFLLGIEVHVGEKAERGLDAVESTEVLLTDLTLEVFVRLALARPLDPS
jgi:hypothetical protein